MGKKPRSVRVQSLKNQALIAEKCHVAECFLDRLRGLIGKTGLGAGAGMLFPRCNSVHMWFMSFPIDVVFLRQAPGVGASDATKWLVSSAHESVRPWKALPLMDLRARDALELPAGTIRQARLSVGDELCIS